MQFGESCIHVRDVLENLNADRAVECPALDRERCGLSFEEPDVVASQRSGRAQAGASRGCCPRPVRNRTNQRSPRARDSRSPARIQHRGLGHRGLPRVPREPARGDAQHRECGRGPRSAWRRPRRIATGAHSRRTPCLVTIDVEDDRYRSVVHERDLHPRTEHAGLHRARPALAAPRRSARRAGSRTPGAAACEKLGRVPFWRLLSAISVNWLTTSAAPPVSSSERSKRPSSFSKIRSRATLPASASASVSVSARRRRRARAGRGRSRRRRHRRHAPTRARPAGRRLS